MNQSNWPFPVVHGKIPESKKPEVTDEPDISQCPWCGAMGPDFRDSDRPLSYCDHASYD